MNRAFSVDAGIDLRPFLTLLTRQGIRHKVSEESGKQVVWVATQEDAKLSAELLQSWQKGELAAVLDTTQRNQGPGLAAWLPLPFMLRNLLRSFLIAPVSIVLIAACLLVALLSQLGSDLNPVLALFYPIIGTQGEFGVLSVLRGIDSLSTALRTLTPALLHFGIIHLVFNMLWLWLFGSMIEALQSSRRMALLVIWLAFVSNTTQYIYSYSTNFGGMSGVVYGLLGYIWIWQVLQPSSRLRVQPAMIGVLIAALVLMEVFASNWIASAAHAGGLIAGMLAAGIAVIYHKLTGAPVR